LPLLQIHDPKAPAGRPVGIDLGTTNSLVAYVEHCNPVVVDDPPHGALLPSVVHYAADGRIVVGAEAAAAAARHPRETIVSVKRFMGKGGDDPETRRLGPYEFEPGGQVVRFKVHGRETTPVEVSADILRELRRRAERRLQAPVGPAVITVPAYFDDAQRQATKDAGRLAGLEVLRLLNEPTAAALAYGLDKKVNGTFVVFDLGGGTFDVTVLVLDDGVFQVKSTGGDSALGGDDMDRAVASVLLAEAGAQGPEAIREAMDVARSVKHALTDSESAPVALREVRRTMRREELDALIRPVVDRTTGPVRRALRDANLSADDVHGIVLVGGATRVPLVRAHVRALFGKEPLADIDPDRVVAMGAAIQADQLAGAGRPDEVLLIDVNPLSLGIETMGGVAEKIVPRNSAIPTRATATFTTYANDQTGFVVHVVQGERELAADCRSLARFELRGIPPMLAGMAKLDVSFDVDADGILHVSARERTTGIEQHVDVKPTYGLTDDEVERMLLDSFENAEADVRERMIREAKVEAERVAMATEHALGEDAALLAPGEAEAIRAALGALRASAADPRAVHDAIEAVERAAIAFVERRMNRVAAAVAIGKTVDDVGRAQ
jgi:molecular chaperone HscA